MAGMFLKKAYSQPPVLSYKSFTAINVDAGNRREKLAITSNFRQNSEQFCCNLQMKTKNKSIELTPTLRNNFPPLPSDPRWAGEGEGTRERARERVPWGEGARGEEGEVTADE